MADLKLIALDDEDLGVLSAHTQDAITRVADLAYLAGERRFAMVINRFNWTSLKTRSGKHERVRSGLRFEKVLSVQVAGFNLRDKSKVLSLLAVTFTPSEEPSGTIQLTFSGDAAVRLQVECIEAELRDLGAHWAAKSRPDHPDDV